MDAIAKIEDLQRVIDETERAQTQLLEEILQDWLELSPSETADESGAIEYELYYDNVDNIPCIDIQTGYNNWYMIPHSMCILDREARREAMKTYHEEQAAQALKDIAKEREREIKTLRARLAQLEAEK